MKFIFQLIVTRIVSANKTFISSDQYSRVEGDNKSQQKVQKHINPLLSNKGVYLLALITRLGIGVSPEIETTISSHLLILHNIVDTLVIFSVWIGTLQICVFM